MSKMEPVQTNSVMYVLLNLLPMWATATVLVGLTILVTMVGLSLIHRRYTPEVLRRNNDVAGFTFGVIGAIYGLLLALALVAVWGSYEKARADATEEEACIIGLHRAAWGLRPGAKEKMESALNRYESAVNNEWGSNKADPTARGAVDDIGHIFAVERDDPAASPFVSEGLQRIDHLADLRAARRAGAEGGMPGFLWIVMILGGVVTVGFSFFFGSENPRSQRVMTSILGAIIALVLFAVLEIDHPYEGEISIQTPFKEGAARLHSER